MKKYHSFAAFFLALALFLPLGASARAAETDASFSVTAQAVILVEAATGDVLYEYHADDRRHPASITKVMTGLLTVEAVERGELSMDTIVTLGDDLYTDIGVGGSTLGMSVGEKLTVRDLLNAALIPSANEACNALATAISGSIPAFVDRMNQRAAELGMTSTHFVNPHGYHNDEHYTTARDISRMCLEAMNHPEFRKIVSTGTYTIPATNLHPEERVLKDTNALMPNAAVQGYRYQYATGIKTGYTSQAGYCLASAAEKDHRTLIAVLLGGNPWYRDGAVVSDSYFTESRRLLEYGFNHFSYKNVLDASQPVDTVPVSLSQQQDYVTVLPSDSITALLPNDLDPALFTQTVDLPEALRAPIEKGQVIGSITVSYGDKTYGTVDLVAATGLERSQMLYILDRVTWIFSFLWVKLLALVLIVAMSLLIARRMVFGPSRRRRRSKKKQVYSSSYRGRKR